MTTIASAAPRRGIRPRQPAHSLELPLLRGVVFRLAARRPERLTKGGGSSREDGATTNRALFNEPVFVSQTDYESIFRCRPAGRDSTTCPWH
jgi:hypothetical protein